MKILFVLDLYKPHIWWSEILFENIIDRLAKKWHEIRILTARYDKKLPEYEKLDNWVEIYRVWWSRYSFTFLCLKKWMELAKDTDIIHCTTHNAAIPASVIWWLSKKKVVLTVHEVFGALWYRFMWLRWIFFMVFETFLFKFHYDKIICVSNYTRNCLRVYLWIKDSKLVTIYNWVDYDIWNSNNFSETWIRNIREKYSLQKNYVWLFFWRPWIFKWLIYFVKAIPEILRVIPNFKVILNVSESVNNKATDVKEFIKENQLESYIIWLWWVQYNELWNYILAADLVVVPSVSEWFGFAAAETCALWQQLVCSNIGALTEVVSWKINFVEPGDPKDIAEKVVDFYNWKFSNISKKEFLWDDNVDQILTCYKSLLW